MAIFRTARYEVKAEALEEAKVVVARFAAEVKQGEPGTKVYLAFQNKVNPYRFTHLMEFEDDAAEAFHRETQWVKDFTKSLYPILLGGMEFEELKLVDIQP